MVQSTILMPMLVAVFLMAGAQYLLIFARNSDAIEHFWFGTASLAAAGASMGYCAIYPQSASDSFLSHDLPRLFAAVWLVTCTWFIVEYSSGDARQRWAALLATLLIVIACIGDLGFNMDDRGSDTPSALGPWHLAGFSALAIMFALAAVAAIRLWSSIKQVRASVVSLLCIGFAAAAIQNALHGFSQLPTAVLIAFLFVVIVATYGLSGAVADGEGSARRLQGEAANASRLSIVGELTASLAHEINQPLGAILSNADAAELLLARPDPPLDEIRQILVDIRRDGIRASDVIRHVRKLVRKRELEFEKLDANSIATDVIELMRSDAYKRRIPITARLLPEPAYLQGDRALIEQMLINLLTNAMDSIDSTSAAGESPPDTPLTLAVSSTIHGEIEFRVIDSGAGVPDERLEHIFDSFYTSKAHGMGLGLSICRSIVEAHGGRIRAENNRDRGATFRATFAPFMDDEPDRGLESPRVKVGRPGTA
ncbi:MAG: sensor histidine kinase [Luteimonas sp.]